MGESIGEFEQLILFAVIRLEADASAVTVRQEIETRTGRAISSGALYTALDRLETRGFLSSRLGEPTPERGGRAKRFFQVTPQGMRAVKETQRALVALWKGVPQLKGGHV